MGRARFVLSAAVPARTQLCFAVFGIAAWAGSIYGIAASAVRVMLVHNTPIAHSASRNVSLRMPKSLTRDKYRYNMQHAVVYTGAGPARKVCSAGIFGCEHEACWQFFCAICCDAMLHAACNEPHTTDT